MLFEQRAFLLEQREILLIEPLGVRRIRRRIAFEQRGLLEELFARGE
jgi:hypothetical protein